MNEIKIEIKGRYKGYTYQTIAMPMGHRCGYVKIPVKNKLYGKDYNYNLGLKKSVMNNKKIGKRGVISLVCWDRKTITPCILFDVHGGLTFSGKLLDTTGWWLGFDCIHSGDAKDKTIMEERYLKMEEEYPLNFDGDVVRTKEYVEQECKNLIDQIIKYFPIKL